MSTKHAGQENAEIVKWARSPATPKPRAGDTRRTTMTLTEKYAIEQAHEQFGKPRAGEHVLKVAGEVQMKALSHDMGLIRRENERLKVERDLLRERERELVEALKAVVEWVVLNKPRTYPSGDWGAYPPDCIEQARALLAKHGC